MEEEDVILSSSQEEVIEDSEVEETPIVPAPKEKQEKTVPYSRFQEVNEELKKLKNTPHHEAGDPIDLIKLGKKLQDYTDDELDFVTDFAKSKKPDAILKALENPFVQAGISAQRTKVEKEKGLTPSGTQPELTREKSLKEKLSEANDSEKEELLKKVGFYKEVRPRADRVQLR